jgi:general secretion pathway protein D
MQQTSMKKLLGASLMGVVLAGALNVTGVAQVVNQAPTLAAIQPTTTPIPLGPSLDVIPYVSSDGYTVQMNLLPTLTEFLGYDDPCAFQTIVGQAVAPTPLPRFRIRQVVTSSIVWDGQTIVMGGLISEKVTKVRDKVPVLGDLPLVGRLFRSEANASSKKNLVIFVTPTIIDPAGNRIHDPEDLPYDPNKVPEQVPFAPTATPPSEK